MPDVCLVSMPFAAPQRPSIALGLLKSALTRADITARVVYANLWYAEAMSLGAILPLERIPVECLAGEWVFSAAAFPEHQTDADVYYRMIAQASPHVDVVPILNALRALAPAFVDMVARRVLAERPRIVACSSMFAQHCATLALLRRIRELDPSVVTIMGGANCESTMGAVTHRCFSWVDFVVNGEADLAFPKLCEEILRRGRGHRVELTGVHAPWHRDGERPTAPTRLVLNRLDDSPMPDYDDFFEALQASSLRGTIVPGLLIETSRGCWWGQKHHCTFCGLNGSGMNFRSKSAERVLAEFDALSKQYGLRDFEVVDNIIDMAHLDSVLPTLAQADPPYNLFYETKSNLKYAQLKRMREAGVTRIQPGIESMHDEILKLMDKGTTALINVALLKWARELGMDVSWNLLMAFPGEQPVWYEEMAQWLPLITHLNPPGSVSPLRFDRFSPYHSQQEKYGLSLTPCMSYSFVYPLSADEINELAYFFEDQPGGVRRCRRYSAGEACAAVRRQVKLWDQAQEFPLPPILSMDDDGERIAIIDTRPCALERRVTLEGAAREVYLACDQARAGRSLGHPEVCDDLVRRRLMLALDGKYLALAVRGTLPNTRHRYPGGDLLEIPAPCLPPAFNREGLVHA